jgi:glycerophosphoryl diester phosphodiesterase
LPSLEAIARYVQRNGFALNLEIKPTPDTELATGRAVGEACARLWHGQATPLLFSSFRPEALQGAREAAAQIPRALLVDTLWSGWFEMARALECVAVVTNHALMDAALLAQLHGAGLRALCYTVNDPPEAHRLVALGIDGLITDRVDRFSPHAAGVFD